MDSIKKDFCKTVLEDYLASGVTWDGAVSLIDRFYPDLLPFLPERPSSYESKWDNVRIGAKGGKRKVRKGKKRAQKRHNNMALRTSALSASPFTKDLMVQLKWSDDTTITALSSWRFGLAQFWNQLPGYFSQYMTIYKMCRILKLSVTCTVINTTAATPAEMVICVLPYSDYSKTLAQVKQLPGHKHRYLSGAGGIDRATLSYSASLNNWLQVDSRAIRDYQQSASEAASTLALLPDTPVLAVYIGGASTEPTLRVFLTVNYHIEFFEPEYPGSVALESGRVPIDMTDKPPEAPGPIKIIPECGRAQRQPVATTWR